VVEGNAPDNSAALSLQKVQEIPERVSGVEARGCLSEYSELAQR
jgi:hypothetical protein